ncbi:unnamed protein product [Calicophoron daubneyi]|uniref:Uncharacterized protein n=1 Tax=Calicophoron daubneyi TaxID=300641 RepID=A0AAV2TVL0_CALDB
MRVAAIDEQLNKYHDDILLSAGDQSPTKPRWRPWFPLQTVTDMMKMEQTLQNENCKADVVAFIQRTPAGTIKERTRCCLARTVSDHLSRQMSRQGTIIKQPFRTASLWAIILETLAECYTDRENSITSIPNQCVAWFQNARDRRGGRSKRRYTCPDMPLAIMTSI